MFSLAYRWRPLRAFHITRSKHRSILIILIQLMFFGNAVADLILAITIAVHDYFVIPTIFTLTFFLHARLRLFVFLFSLKALLYS